MSAPIVPDIYSFVLNTANNFRYVRILEPAIRGMKFMRILCSNYNVILKLNFARSSFILGEEANPRQIDGIVVPSAQTWYECATETINTIDCSIFKQSDPAVDSLFIAIQFTSKIFE